MVYLVFYRLWKTTIPEKTIHFCKKVNHLYYDRIYHIINLIFYLAIFPFLILCMCVFSFFLKRLPDVFNLISFFFSLSMSSWMCISNLVLFYFCYEFSFLKITSFLFLCFSYINFVDWMLSFAFISSCLIIKDFMDINLSLNTG